MINAGTRARVPAWLFLFTLFFTTKIISVFVFTLGIIFILRLLLNTVQNLIAIILNSNAMDLLLHTSNIADMNLQLTTLSRNISLTRIYHQQILQPKIITGIKSKWKLKYRNAGTRARVPASINFLFLFYLFL